MGLELSGSAAPPQPTPKLPAPLPLGTPPPPNQVITAASYPTTELLDVHRGYDATSTANYNDAKSIGASGYLLRSDGQSMSLWITGIDVSFGVSGVTGQSRMLREFFPRSFTDVTLSITGNVANNSQYMELAQFVRIHQWLAIASINQFTSPLEPTMTFFLFNKYGGSPSAPSTAVKNGRTVKGSHRPWSVKGYVTSMAAGATAHVVAPTFQLDLVVTDTFGATGIWSESSETVPSKNPSLLDIFGLSSGNHAVPSDATLWTQDPVTSVIGIGLTPPTPAKPTTPTPKPKPQSPPTRNGKVPWSVSAAGVPTFHVP